MSTRSAPPVTAVVPTHDRPELMRRAVQSILDQEYDGDVEVIVVFDACEPLLPELAVGAGRTLRGAVNERAGWLRDQGAEIESGPEEYAYLPGYYAVFFYDPDGMKLEIVHIPGLAA